MKILVTRYYVPVCDTAVEYLFLPILGTSHTTSVAPWLPSVQDLCLVATMLFLVSLCLSSSLADLTIDLSTAQLDKETGQFCVLQKVRKE